MCGLLMITLEIPPPDSSRSSSPGSGRNAGGRVGSSTTCLPARSTNQSYSQLGRGTTTPVPSAPRTSSTIARPDLVPGVNSTSSGRNRTSEDG
ncbi:MAG: hypothetical protein A2V85_11805 [Chloroflexi bacterium RBG_16_72_14]|nr:MAG: hypothetical protein A2V85_11805 [Chloroflexi bacterium RBG_16_72_14]